MLYSIKLRRVLVFFLIVLPTIVFGQNEGNDILLTKDNNIIQGKITLLGDERVQYIPSGSTILNEIAANKLIKIKFADGTEKVFDRFPVENNVAEEEVYRYPIFDASLVAILPFDFYDEKTGKSIGRNGLQVQRYIERRLNETGSLNILDQRETNSRLRKAEVDYTRLELYSIDELSKILGAGTIIVGSVKYNFYHDVFIDVYEDTYDTEIVVEETTYVDEYGNVDYYTDIYETSSGSDWYVDVEEVEDFDVRTEMQIYEQGKKIFHRERDPFIKWGYLDDWEGNIDWLLKKSPYQLARSR